MTDTLKPCPFCGGAAEIRRMGDRRSSMIIGCSDCGAQVESGDTSVSTRWHWNTRADNADKPDTHPAWIADLLNRRAAVEQELLNIAAGKAPPPTPEQCRAWAVRLGVQTATAATAPTGDT